MSELTVLSGRTDTLLFDSNKRGMKSNPIFMGYSRDSQSNDQCTVFIRQCSFIFAQID